MAENRRTGDRSRKPQRDLASFDLSVFSGREVARLLAQRILFGLGHYAEDDPFDAGDPPKSDRT
jgi:hypothetical protein